MSLVLQQPLGGVVSQSLIHSGLKQHYHQGKLKTFDQLAVKHSSGKKKALWVLINILDMSKDKNKALLLAEGALRGLLFVI